MTALQKRENFTREYEAICNGTMTAGGMVEKPIGRHATKRTHMAVHEMGKPAITHYRVAEKFRAHTRLRLRLETGRTHQIRVHMAYLNHPLVGDQLYGGRPRPPKGATPELFQMLRDFKRQALHAVKLSIAHPITGELMTWQAPIPDDMAAMTEALRADTKANPNIEFLSVMITPAWTAPKTVSALSTTRQGGVSVAPFDSFNMGLHVGDDEQAVLANRYLQISCQTLLCG